MSKIVKQNFTTTKRHDTNYLCTQLLMLNCTLTLELDMDIGHEVGHWVNVYDEC